jgi:hypothetical protein
MMLTVIVGKRECRIVHQVENLSTRFPGTHLSTIQCHIEAFATVRAPPYCRKLGAPSRLSPGEGFQNFTPQEVLSTGFSGPPRFEPPPFRLNALYR